MCWTIEPIRLVCSTNDEIVVDSIKDQYRFYLPTIYVMKKLYQDDLVSLLKNRQNEKKKNRQFYNKKKKVTIIETCTMLNITEKFYL